MKPRYTFAILGLAAITTSIALAQNPRDNKATAQQPPADHGQMQLPPGWTQEDMQACIDAGTPGENHEHLAKAVGQWTGQSKMWMAPNTEPITSECSTKITSIMDGRFTQVETKGSTPMGPFNGLGTYGYDNVTKKFQSTWIDNCGTAIMVGTGELSSDGETMTWVYNYTCPITKKPTTMREIERQTGKDSCTLEMYGIDPKSGKEFKMMEIAMTRKPGSQATATGAR
jgi:hypothetical protein